MIEQKNLDDSDLGQLAHRLGELLDGSETTDSLWTSAEFAHILDHQLKSPLKDDLIAMFDDPTGDISRSGERTFGDLLLSATPSLPLLKLVRHFAKRLINSETREFPDEVARVIYFAAIAAAAVHAQANISSLGANELRLGYAWAHSQKWVHSGLRSLFDKALAT